MLSEARLKALRPSYEKRFRLLNDMEFRDTKHDPKIVVSLGKDSYTDNSVIVLGMTGQYAKWCEEDSELFMTLSYVRGHESQHVLSTTQKAWLFALKRGTEVVIERLLKENNIHIRLVNDRDYEAGVEQLRAIGINLSMKAVMDFVHYVTNSLEDGRIEAIRSAKREDFRKQVVAVRRRTWAMTGVPKNMVCPVEKMSSQLKLQNVLNQLLSLSTQSIFQKGFAENFFGTELEDRVRAIIPHIAKGVTAKTCREMATQAIDICEKLADLIGEASRAPEFSDTIVWIKGSISDFEFGERKTSDNEEEENESNGLPFDNSDLYIELPDEEYDELMEKMKENPQEPNEEAGRNIHVRREHPKEEEQEKETQQQNSDGSGNENSDGNPEGSPMENSNNSEGNPENSSGGEPEQGSGDNSSESNSDTNQDNLGGEQSSMGKSESEIEAGEQDSVSAGNESTSSSDGNTAPDAGKQNATAGPQKGDSSGKQAGNISGGSNPVDEDAILEEMKAAADAAMGMAEESSRNMDNIVHGQEKRQNMKDDQEEEIKKTSEKVIKSINQSADEFEGMKLLELKRKYKVDEILPPELMKEVETLSKRLEQFLKDKKAKFRRQLKSGKLDSSRLAMLAANEINVFKEQKKSKGVSACAEILLDNSGSMGYGKGSKREAACKALTKIEMVFARYFPIKIFAFDYSCAVIHEIIKGWDEHFSRSGAWNFLTKGRYGSGNMDPYSIRVATADILSRPEKKKLIVILSDGAPCCDPQLVTDAVRDARKNGIKVVSIYFEENGYRDEGSEKFFADMYEKDYIACAPEEIGENLITILKKFFV